MLTDDAVKRSERGATAQATYRRHLREMTETTMRASAFQQIIGSATS